MSIFSNAARAIILVAGLAALGASAAYACDNCTGPAYRDGGYDGGRNEVYRDGNSNGDCRGDGCENRYSEGCRDNCYHRDDGCRDNCYRHDDGCRDNCYRADNGCRDNCYRRYDGCRDDCHRADNGCHDNCYRHYDGCHDGCYRGSSNYSCYAGRFDCRFEDGCCDNGFRERFYDAHPVWNGGGAYGFYGE